MESRPQQSGLERIWADSRGNNGLGETLGKGLGTMASSFRIILVSEKKAPKNGNGTRETPRATSIGFRAGFSPVLKSGETLGGSDIIGADSIPTSIPQTVTEYADTLRRAGTTLYRMIRRSGRVMGIVEPDDIVGEFVREVLGGESDLGKAWGRGAGAAGRLAKHSASTARQHLPRETTCELFRRYAVSRKVIDPETGETTRVPRYSTTIDPDTGETLYRGMYGNFGIVESPTLLGFCEGMEAFRKLHGRFRIPNKDHNSLVRIGREKFGSAGRYGMTDPAHIVETDETLSLLHRYFSITNPERFDDVRDWVLGLAPNSSRTNKAWRAMKKARAETERKARRSHPVRFASILPRIEQYRASGTTGMVRPNDPPRTKSERVIPAESTEHPVSEFGIWAGGPINRLGDDVRALIGHCSD